MGGTFGFCVCSSDFNLLVTAAPTLSTSFRIFSIASRVSALRTLAPSAMTTTPVAIACARRFGSRIASLTLSLIAQSFALAVPGAALTNSRNLFPDSARSSRVSIGVSQLKKPWCFSW